MRPTKGEIRKTAASAQAAASPARTAGADCSWGFGRPDAFEGRGDLDQDAVAGDAARLIGCYHGASLVHGRAGVEGKIRIDLGRHSARHELGEFGAERHRKPVGHGGGDCALRRRTASMSPVSATTTVISRS
jgi:hypothetical protein